MDKPKNPNWGISSTVEQSLCKAKVRSSNLLCSSIINNFVYNQNLFIIYLCSIEQSAYNSSGIEYQTFNLRVRGSSPRARIEYGFVAQWFRSRVLDNLLSELKGE